MCANRHDHRPDQRVGPQDGELSTAFERGGPAPLIRVEQNEDDRLRGLHTHVYLLRGVMLEHGPPAERRARQGSGCLDEIDLAGEEIWPGAQGGGVHGWSRWVGGLG